MTSLPLTKSNLKKFENFMSDYSLKMNSKKQQADNLSVTSSRQSKRSRSSVRFQKKNKFHAKRAQSLAVHRKMKKVIADVTPAIKQLESSKRKFILAKEGHFDIKDSKVDLKVLQNEVDMMTKEIAMAKDALRAQYVNKPFKANVWGVYTTTSTPATALTAVTTITVSNFVEWSTFSGLFDLAKCTGMTIHTSTQASHATAAPEMFWNCAYDPESPGVYASIENCLAAAIKTGVRRMAAATQYVSSCPYPVDRSGMTVWKVPHMPPILPDQSTSFTVYTGDWFDTANSTIILGYLKPYIPAASGTTTAITHYIEAHMDFKLRT